MKALILAAGIGKRMRPITEKKPKCLVEISGKPLLQFQLDALSKIGINDITVITGYKANDVELYLNNKYKLAFNKKYETTSSLFSMLLAKEDFMGQDFLLINGDIVFDDKLILPLIESQSESAALIDKHVELVDGEMNVVIEEGRIIRFNKSVKASEADALSLQIVKIGAKDSKLLFERGSSLAKEGERQLFPADAYDTIFEKSIMAPIQREGGLWAEIDTLDDLESCEYLLINNNIGVSK